MKTLMEITGKESGILIVGKFITITNWAADLSKYKIKHLDTLYDIRTVVSSYRILDGYNAEMDRIMEKNPPGTIYTLQQDGKEITIVVPKNFN